MNDQTPQTLATPDGAASVLTDGLGVIDPAWDTDTATMDITTARNSVDVLRLEIVRRGCLECTSERKPTGSAPALPTPRKHWPKRGGLRWCGRHMKTSGRC